MNGKEIRDKVFAILVKFYQIFGGTRQKLHIEVSAFEGLTNSEVIASLNALENKGLIYCPSYGILSNDLTGALAKARFDTRITVEFKDKFAELVENKTLLMESIGEEKTLYTLDKKSEGIFINNFFLSKPRYYSENDCFIDYVLQNPNKEITALDFKKFYKDKTKEEVNKKFEQMIADLKFKGVLKKLFFPKISIKAVKFRNPIIKAHLDELGIEYLDLSKIFTETEKK